MEQLIAVQQTLIGLLSGNANGPFTAVIHPHHDELYQSASAIRRRSLGALSEQYQRLLQAAPLLQVELPLSKTPSRPLSTLRAQEWRPSNCPSKVYILKTYKRDGEDIYSIYACKSCGWKKTFERETYDILPFDQYGNTMRQLCVLDKFHCRKPGTNKHPWWRCFICKSADYEMGTSQNRSLEEHIFLEHTIDEICDCGICGNVEVPPAIRKAWGAFLVSLRSGASTRYSKEYLDALERIVSQGLETTREDDGPLPNASLDADSY